eukprot:252528_1
MATDSTKKKNLDKSKNVYVFTHGKRKLYPLVEQMMMDIGFAKSQIFNAKSMQIGVVGDYTASCWHPSGPDHVRIAVITKIEHKKKRIIGLWAGVTTKRIDVIYLPNAIARQEKIKLCLVSVGVVAITGMFLYKYKSHL